MQSKLTLSLPEKTICEAKQIAKRRCTTVSALFAESVHQWSFDQESERCADKNITADMSDLVGAFSAQTAFDARSARIREKHA